MIDVDRKQLEGDRELHGQAVAKVTAKIAELEAAKQEAQSARADAEQLQKKLSAKMVALNEALL
jgi:hypothetical protein